MQVPTDELSLEVKRAVALASCIALLLVEPALGVRRDSADLRMFRFEFDNDAFLGSDEAFSAGWSPHLDSSLLDCWQGTLPQWIASVPGLGDDGGRGRIVRRATRVTQMIVTPRRAEVAEAHPYDAPGPVVLGLYRSLASGADRRLIAGQSYVGCLGPCAQTAPLAAEEEEPWRPVGLLRVRDMSPFGISRLDFLPAHPASLAAGAMALELNLSYQNTWITSDNVRVALAERSARRMLVRPEDVDAILALPGDAYLVDGEFALLDLTVHYMLGRRLGLYATLSWYDFGGGFLDATIEGFHEALSLSDGQRDLVPRDRWHVVAKIGDRHFVSMHAPEGELGDPVLGLRLALFGAPERWNLVTEVAVKFAWRGEDRLVTTGENDYGLQLSLQRFFRRNALYLSLSAVYFGAGSEPRLTRTAWLPTAIAGWETRVSRRANFVFQLYASRSAIQDTDLPELSANKLQATAGIQWKWGRQALRFGITENLVNFDNTPDIGVTLSLACAFGPDGGEDGHQF